MSPYPVREGDVEAELRRRLRGMPVALEAMAFAKEAHEGQSRDDGSPYFLHPWGVALILVDEAGVSDEEALCAAFLHDVMEDCPQVRPEELSGAFGEGVARMVTALTKPAKGLFDSGEARMEAYIRRVLDAGEGAFRAKLADRLHNLRTWRGAPPEKRRRKLIETCRHIFSVPAEFIDEAAGRLMVLMGESIVEFLVATDAGLAEEQPPGSRMHESSAYRYAGAQPEPWRALLEAHPRPETVLDAYMRCAFPAGDRWPGGSAIWPLRPRTGLLLNVFRWAGPLPPSGVVDRAVFIVKSQLNEELDFPCFDEFDREQRDSDCRNLLEAIADVGGLRVRLPDCCGPAESGCEA